MDKLRILLLGSLKGLASELQKHYDVVTETDSYRADEMLQQGKVHLAVVHLPVAEPDDSDTLALALKADHHPPKIIVFSGPMDRTTKTVRQALTGLDAEPPAVAVVSEEEGLDTILLAVNRCIARYVPAGQKLSIRPRHVLRDIAGYIKPDEDPATLITELEDLFRDLFGDRNSIQLALPDALQGPRGEMATVWAQPRSQAVPEEHPLLVKCGHRETIERVRRRYERYLFRLTPLRLAGYAHTRRFASLAYPAPGSCLDVHRFPAFYAGKAGTGAEEDIGRAIDRLFEESDRIWNRQVPGPSSLLNEDLRTLYLSRFRMDKPKVNASVDRIIKGAPPYGVRAALKGPEVGVAFQARADLSFYPNPVLHLFGDAKDVGGLRALGTKPTRLAIGHGDLRGSSFCVDASGEIWLGRYENLEWGPGAAELAGMEALLKFRCVSNRIIPANLYKLEQVILSSGEFTTFPAHSRLSAEVEPALRWIGHVRKRGTRLSGEMSEYYANLLFFTMREVLAEELPYVHRLHALLSAAMICYRLKHWDNWAGWPGHMPPLPLGL